MTTSEPRNGHMGAVAPVVRTRAQRRLAELRQRLAENAAAARVVADVDAATAGLCACGCGQPITDSSPSAYYASAGCQQVWMARHATNPTEVYRRRDAADYAVDDSARVPLTDPATVGVVPGRRRNPPAEHTGHVHMGYMAPPPIRRHLIYGPGQFEYPLAYRRTCPSCSRFMEPNIYQEVPGEDFAPAMFGDDHRIYLSGPHWTQECSGCGTVILGTVHVPDVSPSRATDGGIEGWTLELHTPYGRVRSTVTQLALARTSTRTAQVFIDDTWASMERDLARFEREWRGRLSRRPIEFQISIAGVSPEAAQLYFGGTLP